MSKLNQIVAVESSVKSRTKTVLDEIYKAVQHPALFDGFVNKYNPVTEGDEVFPTENKNVQLRSNDVLAKVRSALTELFDVTATKDFANCTAKASVVVDGVTLITEAPVSYLLFLEKQLTDFHTLIGKLPTLDTNETWTLDPNQNIWRSEPVAAVRTKKVQKALVLYPHSDKHPAQTQLITEDVTIGHWNKTKFSAALPLPTKEAVLSRIEKLQKALKFAREQANMNEAPLMTVGEAVFNWIYLGK